MMWHLEIRTQPHGDWFSPGGWGPWADEKEAREALARASELWMQVRLRLVETAQSCVCGAPLSSVAPHLCAAAVRESCR